MRTRTTFGIMILAFVLTFLGSTAMSQSFVEDFTTAGVIGTGDVGGGNYTPGANWTMTNGTAVLYTFSPGQVVLGHGNGIGPSNIAPDILLYNSDLGRGTNSFRGDYRVYLVFGYQNPTNYYLAIVNRLYRASIGGRHTLVVGKVENAVETWLAGSSDATWYEAAPPYSYKTAVTWNPATGEISANTQEYDGDGLATTNTASIAVFTDSTFMTEGRMGVMMNYPSGTSARYITEVSFTAVFDKGTVVVIQ